MKPYLKTLAVIAAIGSIPAFAADVQMTGRVDTVCKIAPSDISGDGQNGFSAQLRVFCNSASGVRISARLMDGDTAGYTIVTNHGEQVIRSGDAVEILGYDNAVNNNEPVSILPVSESGTSAKPELVFEIIAG